MFQKVNNWKIKKQSIKIDHPWDSSFHKEGIKLLLQQVLTVNKHSPGKLEAHVQHYCILCHTDHVSQLSEKHRKQNKTRFMAAYFVTKIIKRKNQNE